MFDEDINLEINPESALKQQLLLQLHFKQDRLLVLSTVGGHGRLPKKTNLSQENAFSSKWLQNISRTLLLLIFKLSYIVFCWQFRESETLIMK